MAKFLKEAARVKQVLSANTEIFAQVSIILWKLRTNSPNQCFYISRGICGEGSTKDQSIFPLSDQSVKFSYRKLMLVSPRI